MKLGTTYSHRHINYLKLNNKKAFKELLKFKFDILRLCCYWDEIQPNRDTYDFSKIESLLEECEKAGQEVILTAGMKAPRWPEYYLPKWIKHNRVNELDAEISRFITKTVQVLKHYRCIKYWQAENEPLDPSGPENLFIKKDFLKKEIDIIRSSDNSRKILVSIWGNEAKQRNTPSVLKNLGDLAGLDLYYKVPFFYKFYRGPKCSSDYFRKFISKSTKPVWITELQAEPWEPGEIVPKNPDPPSMSTKILKENYLKAIELNPQVILLWGYEYWYYRKMMGDDRLWNAIEEILNKRH